MSGVLTRVAGRLRTGHDAVAGISRLLALVCLIGLVGMLPWLSGKDPALTILRATSSDREPTPEVLESIRKTTRSEERRVGKECRSRWSPYH